MTVFIGVPLAFGFVGVDFEHHNPISHKESPSYNGRIGSRTLFFAADSLKKEYPKKDFSNHRQFGSYSDHYFNDEYFNFPAPACGYTPDPDSHLKMKLLYTSGLDVPTYITPLIADLDGDGEIEIISIGMKGFFGWGSPVQAERSGNLMIFEGKSGRVVREIITPKMAFLGPTPIVVGDINNDGYAEIIISTIDHSENSSTDRGRLICYNHLGVELWRTKDKIGTNYQRSFGGSPALADFNGDGIPEVYIYNEIYNAQNGNKLVDGGQHGIGMMHDAIFGAVSTTIAADLTSHDGLELAAGNSVYEITLNNLNGVIGNTMIPINANFQVNGRPARDGFTSVGDIDLDGHLDVVVTTRRYTSSSNEPRTLYVWDPREKILMASAVLPHTKGTALHTGLAFIGDTDGNGKPNIGVATPFRLSMFSYDGTGILKKNWDLITDDQSGLTTMTMFDLNMDGIQEIIYRDQTSLMILDASKNVPVLVGSHPSFSDTGAEGPIVGDVTGDGRAEILITSNTSNKPGLPEGRIQVFTSDLGPWAPARSVWNQYSYFNVHIKDDLTVPAVQPDHGHTFFRDNIHCPDTFNERPLNNFLSQATYYNENGCFSFPVADATVSLILESVPQLNNPFVEIFFQVYNISGDAALKPGVPIAFYDKEPSDGGVLLHVEILKKTVPPKGNSGKIGLKIKSNRQDLRRIVAVVNDDGKSDIFPNLISPANPECNYENNKAILEWELVPAPIGDPFQTFCFPATIGDLELEGENILWYATKISNIPLPTTTPLEDNQLYYASQTIRNIESSERLAVIAALDLVELPTGEAEQFFCATDNPTVASISMEGTALAWYADPGGASVLDPSLALEDGRIYYAASTNPDTGCESHPYVAVKAHVVVCDIKIFNALSLNNNGQNDYLIIENIAFFPVNKLDIYNRYGKLVFTTSGYGTGSNYFYGEANVKGVVNRGEKLPTGTYLYTFSYQHPIEKKEIKRTGTLYLLNTE